MPDIDFGQLSEALNDKMDRDAHNVQSPSAVVVAKQDPISDNDYTWYRLYSDGWVEQGGTKTYSNADEIKTITLPITMFDSNYTLQLTRKDGSSPDNDTSYSRQQYNSKSTTGFSFWWSINNRQTSIDWEVKGMAA